MQKKTFIVLSFLAFSSLRAEALDQLYYCGKLFDPVNGKWLSNQILQVREGKIIAVNPTAPPKNAEVFDFKTKYIIPGLIDTHTHLFLSDLSYSRDFAKGTAEFIRKTSRESRIKLGLSRARSMLRSGFTSVRDLGNDGGIDIRTHAGIETPRFYTSGKGFAPVDGQLPAGTPENILTSEYSKLSGHPQDALKNFSFDLLKLYADEDPNPAVTPLPLLTEWVDYGKKKGLKVAVHAIFHTAIENTLKTNADTLEHGNEITKDQLKTLAGKDMFFVPSNANALLIEQARKMKLQGVKEQFEQYCRNVKNAEKAGVKIAFGSDNYFSLESQNISFGESTLKAVIRMSKCGLTPLKTITAATSMAAKALGKEHELGELKSGAFADFIVLKNDPGKNMNELLSPEKIFKSGIEVK
jgi:imidazolonepropionase-like amidohydrolase